jgi:hypothetical protein
MPVYPSVYFHPILRGLAINLVPVPLVQLLKLLACDLHHGTERSRQLHIMWPAEENPDLIVRKSPGSRPSLSLT